MDRRSYMKAIGAGAAGFVGLAACTSEDSSTDTDDRKRRTVGGKETRTDKKTQQTQTEQSQADKKTETAKKQSPQAETAVKTTQTSTGSGSDTQVKLLSEEFYTAEYGGFGVKGEAKNVSGEDLMSITINTYYFDSDGTRFAQGMHIANEVQAGVTYEYDSSALSMDGADKVDHYEIEVEVMDF